MAKNTVLEYARDILYATELIQLGARMPVLTDEVALSRERLIKLYKEVSGESPSKGMLPFSEDWFLTIRANTEASLYINLYRYCMSESGLDHRKALVTAYKLLQEQMSLSGQASCLTITRAWTLLRLIKGDVLSTTKCIKCGGAFVTHAYTLKQTYVCSHCKPPPARAVALSSRKVTSA